ncbi:MAG: T9SS type A sorting domain-containing protein [Candidatus Neomarinimicrobiota bacterium]
MRKGLLIAILLACVAASPALGRDWTPVESPWEIVAVLDSAVWPQFAVVDANGNIWIGDYSGPMDIYGPDGNLIAVWDSVTYNDGTTDVTAGFRACKGMNVAANGNILYGLAAGLVELDVSALTTTTDTVTATAVHFHATSGSLTGPAVDAEGYIYVGMVAGTNPITVLNPDFSVSQTIELPGGAPWARGLAVTSDATTIIPADLGAGPVLKMWTTTNFVDYEYTDSVYTDVNGDTIFWDQKVCLHWGPDSALWVSVVDYATTTDSLHNNVTVLDFDKGEYYRVYHPDALIDTTTTPDWQDTEYGKGFRGVAFSKNEAVAYLVGNDQGAVYIYRNKLMAVDERSPGLPDGYRLAQNYPNPFNPTTRIVYEIPADELVSIDIYNVLGEKVRTLVSGEVTAGAHTVIWDAKADNGMLVASGMYIYRLKTTRGSVTKTMIFIK